MDKFGGRVVSSDEMEVVAGSLVGFSRFDAVGSGVASTSIDDDVAAPVGVINWGFFRP